MFTVTAFAIPDNMPNKDKYGLWRVLILDDDLERLEQFKKMWTNNGAILTCTTTAEECIEALKKNGPYDFLFLDHDLGGKVMVPPDSPEPTGTTVAKWLSDKPTLFEGTTIYLHTFNPQGAINMKGYLPKAEICPMAWVKKLPPDFFKVVNDENA